MKIITVPHPTLRETAREITQLDTKMYQLIQELGDTLAHKKDPQGVGLAAPQVDRLWQLFTTYLPTDNSDQPVLRHFINPRITKTSRKVTIGPESEPILEGCLSIPGLYGPVPRWEWVELEFQTATPTGLQNHSQRFDAFAARVIQHEHDHLHGRLFTDYTLEFDLPLYQENLRTNKLEPTDASLVRSF